MRAQYQYAIASGYNVALAGLANWESLLAGGRYFYPPQGFGSFNPGIYRVRGDGTLYIAGFGEIEWVMRYFLYAQHRLLMTSYCNTGYSGKVTIYTKTDNASAYARYNAVMVLPKLSESQTNFKILENYKIRFTRMEAL